MLAEIHRTLASGGKLYAEEAEWTDILAILRLFEKMDQQPWDIFRGEQHTWRERFTAAGFTVLQEQETERIRLRPEDNELGAAAAIHGIEVAQRRIAYILKK